MVNFLENCQYTIRVLEFSDMDIIKLCLNQIVTEFKKDLFVAPTVEYIKKIILGYGFSIGIFFNSSIVGMASIVYPKLGKNNLGHYLNFNNDELLSVVQLEHIFINPSYRGHGLAKYLIDFLLTTLVSRHTVLLSTISPQNISSLSFAFKIHQHIIAYSKVYGVDRYIMCRDFSRCTSNSESTSIKISIYDLIGVNKMLNDGYIGVGFESQKNLIKFVKGWQRE